MKMPCSLDDWLNSFSKRGNEEFVFSLLNERAHYWAISPA